jgi:site-specific recombinase XerD
MSQKIGVQPIKAIASKELCDAFEDFILSREAMMCSKATLSWYKNMLGKFIEWLTGQGITELNEIKSRQVRQYISGLVDRDLSDTYIHGYARVIRTFLRFLLSENYIPEPVTFPMPALSSKRLLVLSAEEVQTLVKACQSSRDKALILLMVDTGLRRSEVCALNWVDVDISSGLVRVVRGKGGKARSVVVGALTRRALIAYRRELEPGIEQPLFQTTNGTRLSSNGLRSLILRLGNRTGIHVHPHALRRTFATLSLRSGMNLLHLQGLLGHSSLEMTRRYVQMVDDDLLEAHRKHGPIDSILQKSKK